CSCTLSSGWPLIKNVIYILVSLSPPFHFLLLLQPMLCLPLLLKICAHLLPGLNLKQPNSSPLKELRQFTPSHSSAQPEQKDLSSNGSSLTGCTLFAVNLTDSPKSRPVLNSPGD
uniref:Uncharacterized protein n=1 Tax=Geospiza parvula TaxID=87175 RepID=A0A8C3NAS5_GEOPR